jgi:hypothetical protein
MRINILDLNRRHSLSSWVHTIIEDAKSCSDEAVERQFIGAVLERRFKGLVILNRAAQVSGHQTTQAGDFQISRVVFHVTSSPSRNVIQKCAENIRAGLHPMLLVPAEQGDKARILAQDEGVDKELSIISMETFITLNIIELATDENKDFLGVLNEIVEIYNRRLAIVESNPSLQIQVR